MQQSEATKPTAEAALESFGYQAGRDLCEFLRHVHWIASGMDGEVEDDALAASHLGQIVLKAATHDDRRRKPCVARQTSH